MSTYRIISINLATLSHFLIEAYSDYGRYVSSEFAMLQEPRIPIDTVNKDGRSPEEVGNYTISRIRDREGGADGWAGMGRGEGREW